ncbi:HtaA domain-containing protein [Streptomyces sp. NBC_00322]|uniref:HtaA domain-containing protein n=1 Tax=Streptomyces sp. NBC_00322 TaxID=2975712 RepID=UPI002E2D8DA9|nr:HtaA domain-containing protein [Streptomyces sp. NBC_00322]
MSATPRPIALVSAVATAAALGAAALAFPAFAAEKAPASAPGARALELKDGTLDWGFKESFRKYIASPFAHGTITMGDGARQAPGNGVFTFVDGTGTYDTGTHATANSFKGSVHFTAHEGVLDIRFSDLRLSTKGSAAPTGEITADVVTKKRNGTFESKNDVAIAALDMRGVRPGQGTGGAMVFKDIPAKLTKGAAEAFAGYYKEGDPLDPATLTVTAKTPGPRPTPTKSAPTKPAPTEPASTKPTAKPTSGTSSPAAPAPGKVLNGRLTWGVKESWRRYVDDTCGGNVTPAGGATGNGSVYDFRLGTAELDPAARRADARFAGSVRFVCAAHGINWTIGDLWIKTSGSTGTLVADVTTAKGTRNDVTFAKLDLSKADFTAKNGVVTLKDVPAALTKDGAAQFAGPNGEAFYQPGTAVDPVTVAFTLDPDAALPGTAGGTSGETSGGSDTSGAGTNAVGTVGGTGALATTGSMVPADQLLAASGAVAVAGAGVVLAVRRRTTARA